MSSGGGTFPYVVGQLLYKKCSLLSLTIIIKHIFQATKDWYVLGKLARIGVGKYLTMA